MLLSGRGRLWMLLKWARSIMDAIKWARSIMDATYVGEVDCGCY